MISLLDNDLYKFTMQRCVLEHFPLAKAKYKFINRGKEKFEEHMLRGLRQQINSFADLQLKSHERDYLSSQNWVNKKYLDYISSYRFNPKQITTYLNEGDLVLSIDGLWHETILWEVPLLATISEIFFQEKYPDYKSFIEKTTYKTKMLNAYDCNWMEFGTRRRRNLLSQKLAIAEMIGKKNFIGTSNVYLAMLNDIKCVGTMAHEFIMGVASLYGLRSVHGIAAGFWFHTFGSGNNVILTDTFGSDLFFHELKTNYFLRDWSIRQDSGNPYSFIHKAEDFYKSIGIRPQDVTICFSDGLYTDKAELLKDYCDEAGFNCVFGIGTNFTNDFDESPLNIVIKLSEINGKGVVKLSDVDGKECGTYEAIASVKAEVKKILQGEI